MNIEIAKILFGILTPISLAIIGYFINKTLAEQGRQWKENDILLAKRMEIYSKMATPLNQIYCYVQDVGDYKEQQPKDVIENKRVCDRAFHTYRPIWSEETINSYKEFMRSAFKMFSGSGVDAKIRTVSTEKKAAAKVGATTRWLPEWDNQITEERDTEHHKKYVALMNAISQDLRFTITFK